MLPELISQPFGQRLGDRHPHLSLLDLLGPSPLDRQLVGRLRLQIPLLGF